MSSSAMPQLRAVSSATLSGSSAAPQEEVDALAQQVDALAICSLPQTTQQPPTEGAPVYTLVLCLSIELIAKRIVHFLSARDVSRLNSTCMHIRVALSNVQRPDPFSATTIAWSDLFNHPLLSPDVCTAIGQPPLNRNSRSIAFIKTLQQLANAIKSILTPPQNPVAQEPALIHQDNASGLLKAAFPLMDTRQFSETQLAGVLEFTQAILTFPGIDPKSLEFAFKKACQGHLPLLQILLQFTASQELLEKRDRAYLGIDLAGAAKGHPECLQFLIIQYEKFLQRIPPSSLGDALTNAGSHLECLELLIQLIESKELLKKIPPAYLAHALTNAARGGHLACVERLLQFIESKGLFKEIPPKFLGAALTAAAHGLPHPVPGLAQCLRLLMHSIESQGLLESIDSECLGEALTGAVSRRHIECVQILMQSEGFCKKMTPESMEKALRNTFVQIQLSGTFASKAPPKDPLTCLQPLLQLTASQGFLEKIPQQSLGIVLDLASDGHPKCLQFLIQHEQFLQRIPPSSLGDALATAGSHLECLELLLQFIESQGGLLESIDSSSLGRALKNAAGSRHPACVERLLQFMESKRLLQKILPQILGLALFSAAAQSQSECLSLLMHSIESQGLLESIDSDRVINVLSIDPAHFIDFLNINSARLIDVLNAAIGHNNIEGVKILMQSEGFCKQLTPGSIKKALEKAHHLPECVLLLTQLQQRRQELPSS